MAEEQIYDDTELERELRQAMFGEDDISLFKIIQENLRVKHELANNETVKVMLRGMWQQVADFFDEICSADTICGLQPTDKLVTAHARMRANFDAVAAINDSFKDARAAEQQLEAADMDERLQEDLQQ